MNSVLQILLANLDEAYEKKGWHGTNLRGAVRGLTADDVYWRPAKSRNSIWDLTAHAAYWKYAVRRRLTGGVKRGSFPMKGSNWLTPAREDDGAWREALALLDAEHRQLREAVASMTAADLRDSKKVQMAYGIAAHDLYHAGQIQLIKRLRNA
jgi:uncharacterized damage-inducible protein DinB